MGDIRAVSTSHRCSGGNLAFPSPRPAASFRHPICPIGISPVRIAVPQGSRIRGHPPLWVLMILKLCDPSSQYSRRPNRCRIALPAVASLRRFVKCRFQFLYGFRAARLRTFFISVSRRFLLPTGGSARASPGRYGSNGLIFTISGIGADAARPQSRYHPKAREGRLAGSLGRRFPLLQVFGPDRR